GPRGAGGRDRGRGRQHGRAGRGIELVRRRVAARGLSGVGHCVLFPAVRPALARAGHASLAWLAALGIAALGAPGQAAPVPPIHDLAVIEFVESPPTGLVVSGGLLGVPDSSGVFPARYQRYDLPTGNSADPGHVAGDALVFTNLRPGTYRLAMVFLSESRLAAKVLPKNGSKLEDRCTIYGDSIPALTFRIADGECRYLGRIVRRPL